MVNVELILCCDEPGCTMSAKVQAHLSTDYRLMFDELTVPTGWRLRRNYNHPGPEWGNPSIFCVCSNHNSYAQEETKHEDLASRK